MKHRRYLISTLVLFVFYGKVSFAQDLSNLYPIAQYTLINTAQDELGLQDSLILDNISFADGNGVYSNGLYPGTDPNGCKIESPHFSALYDSIWAIRLEFNIGDLDGLRHPIIICGGSYRYLGFMVGSDNTFELLFNNGYTTALDNVFPEADRWYQLTIIHYRDLPLTKFYLDGALIASSDTALVRNMNDGNILNIHPGIGIAFLGYWRNLEIYGTEITSATRFEHTKATGFFVQPNPFSTSLQFDVGEIPAVEWDIINVEGTVAKKGAMLPGNNRIDLTDEVPGIYILLLRDQQGGIRATKKIIKTPNE